MRDIRVPSLHRFLDKAEGWSMSDCCCSNTSTKPKQICPECGSTCKSVGMPTLYHQVRFPENQSLITDSYYFCPAKLCSVGYFSSADNTIPKQHLRSYPAIQNNALCYCFDIDAERYLSALNDHREEPIINFIKQRTKANECACDIRNPSGQCCLANFKNMSQVTA
ncbi:putative iron-sulfur cluster-binding metallochaperone [Methylomonas lenta]|uniref:putative iron-sulfur cluster-binding metallochaperone n=1 Tax=Methylomonas lenta TaxID=980561 RepID=UPI0018DD6849